MKSDQYIDNTDETSLLSAFNKTRTETMSICNPLNRDDYMVQAIPEVSPAKWHLAHTTWFFENFILKKYYREYRQFDENYMFLFNSYYETVGEYLPKTKRSIISRPTLEEVKNYRSHVNEAISDLLGNLKGKDLQEVRTLLTLGINHEQQHQELLLMDIKMNYSVSPYLPVYSKVIRRNKFTSEKPGWISFKEIVADAGYDGYGFCFDNELPKHHELIPGFQISNRLVTNGEFMDFIRDGGYTRPELWLSDGWAAKRRNNWNAPLYWEKGDGGFNYFTLSGRRTVDPLEPVIHISYYEADAFARWAGCKLPTEFQWEHAMRSMNLQHQGNTLGSGLYHPDPQEAAETDMSGPGGAWEWTSSLYSPYPGFKPLQGSVGEYNGKFMSNQMVLRGMSCVTPDGHSRLSYRNFYHPEDRWQFAGLRLCKD